MADRFGRLFHLPIQLVNHGNEGLVIAGDLHTRKKEQIDIDGIQFFSKPLSFARLYSFIRHNYRKINKFEPDVLIASGDSYLGYIGFNYAQKLNIPFVFDVYDDYTVFGTNKIPGMKALFYKSVSKADLVVTSSQPLKDKLTVFNKNIIIIENGYDPEAFRPMSREKCRQRFNIPEQETVIGYFGSLTPDLGINILLEAADILHRDIAQLHFILAGHNGMGGDFDQQKVDYRGFLPQAEIPFLINACDVVAIPYLPSKQVEQSNACKIAEYIACQVPIVATIVSNHAEIFADAPQSLCNPGDPESMALTIRAQLIEPQLIKNTENLTWKNLAGKLSTALENLLMQKLGRF